ncbi:MAG: hypothetical protein ACP5SA_00035 [Candidatus Micrarchaeia archaeon]
MERKRGRKVRRKAIRGSKRIKEGKLEEASAPGNAWLSNDEVLLKSIMKKKDVLKGKNASLLLHALSVLSKSMRDITYREGFSIGKMLFAMSSKGKRYSFYEESIPELVSFLESAGLGQVTYTAFPNKLTIRIYSDGYYLGAKIHAFEAGLISGYVSTGRHEYSHVVEKACVNDNSEYCEFEFYGNAIEEGSEIESSSLLDRTIDGIIASSGNSLAHSYLSLLSKVVTNRSYKDEMSALMAYIGEGLGKRLLSNGRRSARLEKAIEIAGDICIAEPKIERTKPFSISMAFDGTRISKEFVNLSLSFLGGFLPKLSSAKELKAIEINRYNLHKIRIAEAPRG